MRLSGRLILLVKCRAKPRAHRAADALGDVRLNERNVTRPVNYAKYSRQAAAHGGSLRPSRTRIMANLVATATVHTDQSTYSISAPFGPQCLAPLLCHVFVFSGSYRVLWKLCAGIDGGRNWLSLLVMVVCVPDGYVIEMIDV